MNLFDFYSSLRAEILKIVTGVKDSNESLFWDDTTPNSKTKRNLEELLTNYLSRAKEYGVYLVTRHCDCKNPNHEGYYITNNYGFDISYRDANYISGGVQVYQGPRFARCPCSERNPIDSHHVIDEFIYSSSADRKMCHSLAIILSDIAEAIECAEEKRSRSAIREHLLRAILQINDQLLPEPMDLYIQSMLPKFRSSNPIIT